MKKFNFFRTIRLRIWLYLIDIRICKINEQTSSLYYGKSFESSAPEKKDRTSEIMTAVLNIFTNGKNVVSLERYLLELGKIVKGFKDSCEDKIKFEALLEAEKESVKEEIRLYESLLKNLEIVFNRKKPLFL